MKREIQKLIYIETTIPSFYHTSRTDAESRVRQKWTRQWWNEYADIFTLVSSAAVIEELTGGTGEKIQDRLDLLKDVELLSITGDIEQTARIYMADQEINEVRKIRHEISARFDHDVSRLVAHYQEFEKELRRSGEYRFVDSKRVYEKSKAV